MNKIFDTICRKHTGRSRRVSSWDRTGGNDDFIRVQPGETAEIARIEGPACINHIWMTIFNPERYYLRRMVLRMWWDGEQSPSVEVPVGDFFGMGHGICTDFVSFPLQMSPEGGKGFNCFFPMPFESMAVIELANEGESGEAQVYFYFDYEQEEQPEDLLRFHAQWRRENPTDGVDDSQETNTEFQLQGTNLSGDGNYVILEAEGQGNYAGCHLNIHNLRRTDDFNWYGEGDDMIFIDGEPFPPSLHGTGAEDYFNTAWCPTKSQHAPFHGIILPGGPNWAGKISLYRYHILDPIRFSKSIRVTIEHGHANKRSDDYSSTAYWYQDEPHTAKVDLLPVEQRLPRLTFDYDIYQEYMEKGIF